MYFPFVLVLFSSTLIRSSSGQKCSGGFAAHSDCTKYLECVHGYYVTRACATGLHWNAGGNYCDWSTSSGCGSGGATSASPSMQTTTTTTTPKSTATAIISNAEFQCAARTKNGNPNASYYAGFLESLPKALISDRNEAAKFLAHAVWETVGFQYTKEVYCQTNMAACAAAYPNYQGGKRGQVYYGRGMLQLTWDYNYAACSQALYGDDRLIQNPDQVADVPSIGWATAAWFWKVNVHAVAQRFGNTLKAINGALECDGGPNSQNMILRFNHYKQVLKCLTIQSPPDANGYCRAYNFFSLKI